MSEKTRARSPVSPGDMVGGKYRVERVLGAGGMGVVVAATHVDLGQPVALKFILPEALSGKDAVERFMREARAAVRLKSEHVARVHDVGRDPEDRPYMVLELLEGHDLAKLNKQKGPLPVADAVEYVLQACEALVEAHAAGIVHRDLKPQNLFVTRRLNGAPLVKVLDFGIAKAIGPAAAGQLSLTDSAAVIGSPLYMAPEQMRSARTADARSDIWALGVILYELLGGQLPFDGENVTEVCIRVVNEEPPSLLTLRPGLDATLVSLVMRCLVKDPDGRFQSVAQLAATLEPFSRSALQGGPVRPWRSFEDTQDSRANPKTGAALLADETGPSTAVTMPSAAPPHNDDAKKLVSTDVAWGHASSDARASSQRERPRSFVKGLAAGVFVTFAAAAVAAFLLLRPGASSVAAPPPGAGALAPASLPGSTQPQAEGPQPPPQTHASPSEAATTTGAESVSSANAPLAGSGTAAAAGGSASRVVRHAPGRAPAGRSSTAAPPAANGATTAAPSPAATVPRAGTEPVAPNGAPILP